MKSRAQIDLPLLWETVRRAIPPHISHLMTVSVDDIFYSHQSELMIIGEEWRPPFLQARKLWQICKIINTSIKLRPQTTKLRSDPDENRPLLKASESNIWDMDALFFWIKYEIQPMQKDRTLRYSWHEPIFWHFVLRDFFINQSERNRFFFAKHITHQIELILEEISLCILGTIHNLFWWYHNLWFVCIVSADVIKFSIIAPMSLSILKYNTLFPLFVRVFWALMPAGSHVH